MPYILPEDLIPWLSDRNIWADVPTRKIKRYWQHLKDVGSDLATASPQCDHHPLWIWGDAAHYNKEQNIIVICFGSVLDDNTDSIKQRFPLVLCREDLWMQLEWIVLLVLYLFYLKTCSIYIFIFASIMLEPATLRNWVVAIRLYIPTWSPPLVRSAFVRTSWISVFWSPCCCGAGSDLLSL